MPFHRHTVKGSSGKALWLDCTNHGIDCTFCCAGLNPCRFFSCLSRNPLYLPASSQSMTVFSKVISESPKNLSRCSRFRRNSPSEPKTADTTWSRLFRRQRITRSSRFRGTAISKECLVIMIARVSVRVWGLISLLGSGIGIWWGFGLSSGLRLG